MTDTEKIAANKTRISKEKDVLVETIGLYKLFPHKEGLLKKEKSWIRALSDVNIYIKNGEVLGLVGESGCGKSTLAKIILRLEIPSSGKVLFEGKDVHKLKGEELFLYRRSVQMIFQDPYASLNPRRTIGQTLVEPFIVHKMGTKREREEWVSELLEEVGLRPQDKNRYPHQLSGGQRQRVGIARALALRPKLVVADEPVSALDVSIQAQILNLMMRLRKRYGLAYLFISHDLNVIYHMSDRIAVMYLGRIMEECKREGFFEKKHHPYTELLLNSIPDPEKSKEKKEIIKKSDPPSPIHLPKGCPFSTRCPEAVNECKEKMPSLSKISDGQYVACIRMS